MSTSAGDVAAAPRAAEDGRASAGPVAPGRASASSSVLVVAALTAALVLPLLVGLVANREPRWFPVLDLAQTELRVRDVGTADSPLIGLPGRIGSDDRQGSHPGPLSFYALAPVYRLLGGSSWALQAASVAVHAAAAATAVALALRRGGLPLALAVATALAFLVLGYGVQTLSVPWNPYLPLLWWMVVMLASWSVLQRDWMALPILVLAGSLCGQTHIPYLGLCLGLGALAVAGAAAGLRRHDRAQRRAAARWGVAALAVGVAVWLPPTLDQLLREPGNFGIIVDHFATPQGETVGISRAASLAVQRLDVGHLVADQLVEPGTLTVNSERGRHANRLRGAAVLTVWALSAIAAVAGRRQDEGFGPGLLRLHAVVAAGFVLGVVSLSRVFGVVWYYLMLWMWGIAALMVVATAATGWALVRGWRPRWAERTPVGAGVALAGVLLLAAVGRSAMAAPDAEPPDAFQSRMLAALVAPTVEAIRSGAGPADGAGGRYLVTWYDAAYIGSTGYGLLNELERAGFDVGAAELRRAVATPHRVLHPEEATAQVALATGMWIDRWLQVDGAVQVAHVDPRSLEERAEFMALRREVIRSLRASGPPDAVERVDRSLFGLAIDEEVPEAVRERLARMLELGVPFAVFLAPPAALA